MIKKTNSANATSAPRLEQESKQTMPLTPLNFILMAVAGAMIVCGFLLMLGSNSSAEQFNPDIFSTRRVVIGPGLAFIGYIFMGVAIMFKRKSNTEAR